MISVLFSHSPLASWFLYPTENWKGKGRDAHSVTRPGTVDMAFMCSPLTLISSPRLMIFPQSWSKYFAVLHVDSLGSEFRSESNLLYRYLESVVTPGSFSWFDFIITVIIVIALARLDEMVLSYTCLACFVQFVSSPLLFEDFVKLKMIELVIKDLQEIGTHPTWHFINTRKGKLFKMLIMAMERKMLNLGTFFPESKMLMGVVSKGNAVYRYFIVFVCLHLT